jgi:hypothetical protein
MWIHRPGKQQNDDDDGSSNNVSLSDTDVLDYNNVVMKIIIQIKKNN